MPPGRPASGTTSISAWPPTRARSASTASTTTASTRAAKTGTTAWRRASLPCSPASARRPAATSACRTTATKWPSARSRCGSCRPTARRRSRLDGNAAVKAVLAFPEIEWEGLGDGQREGAAQSAAAADPRDARRRRGRTGCSSSTSRHDPRCPERAGAEEGVAVPRPAAPDAPVQGRRRRGNPSDSRSIRSSRRTGSSSCTTTPSRSRGPSFCRGSARRRTTPAWADLAERRVCCASASVAGTKRWARSRSGPTGFLYIAVGDGGGRNHPQSEAGPELDDAPACVLRIDIDRQERERTTPCPSRNPFVGRKDALPRDLGLRPPKRLAATRLIERPACCGRADVGQDLWEEIDIVRKGGNYGWKCAEGYHRSGQVPSRLRPKLPTRSGNIDHSVGKSITGMLTGRRFPTCTGTISTGRLRRRQAVGPGVRREGRQGGPQHVHSVERPAGAGVWRGRAPSG